MAIETVERAYTPEEYLALERAAEYKSEYVNGRIYAMAGASPEHVTITLNVGGELQRQFRGASVGPSSTIYASRSARRACTHTRM
jgi:Uma2 family endonuclease